MDCSNAADAYLNVLPPMLQSFMRHLASSLMHVSRRAGQDHGACVDENIMREAYGELADFMIKSQHGSPEARREGELLVRKLLFQLGTSLSNYLNRSTFSGVSKGKPSSVSPQKLMAYAFGRNGVLHHLPTNRSFTIGRDYFGNEISIGDEWHISRVHALVLPDSAEGHYNIVDLGCLNGFILSLRICDGKVKWLSDVQSKPKARRPVLVAWDESAVLDLRNGCSLFFNPPPCQLCCERDRDKRAPCGHGLLCHRCFGAVMAGTRQCLSCPLCGQHLLWSQHSSRPSVVLQSL